MPPISIAAKLLTNIRETTTAAFAAIAVVANKSDTSSLWQVHVSHPTPAYVAHSHRCRRECLCTTPVVVFDKDYELQPSWMWQSDLERAQSEATERDNQVQAARPTKKLRPHNVLERGSSLSSQRNLVSELRILMRLLVALVVGGVIGMERRAANSLAGVRTFSLVSLGAAVFMSTTLVAFPTADPARVAAAISSSVGFLGAGAMHKNAKHSKGLTTASSVWLAAALGIAAASGMFVLSFTGAISTVLIARYARFDSSLQLIRGDPTVVDEREHDGENSSRSGRRSSDPEDDYIYPSEKEDAIYGDDVYRAGDNGRYNSGEVIKQSASIDCDPSSQHSSPEGGVQAWELENGEGKGREGGRIQGPKDD